MRPVERYKSLVAATFVFLFYSYLLNYLFELGYITAPPVYVILVFSIVLIPVVLVLGFQKNILASPLLSWAAFFIVLTFAWFILFRNYEVSFQLVKDRVLAVLFLLAAFLALSGIKAMNAGKWAVLAAVLLAVANNIYEFVNPFSFTPLYQEGASPGRAAGFYINANMSGEALVLGMIFTISLLPRQLRVSYMVLVLVGVLLTLSRASILAYVIIVTILVAQRIVSVKAFVIGMSILALFLIWVVPATLSHLIEIPDVNRADVVERIAWAFDPFGVEDYSLRERQDVLTLAWETFVRSPVIGEGIGAAEAWVEPVSTHNMYLYYMVEYGILGVLIVPALTLVCISGARGEARQIAIPFAVCVLVLAFFSHNITSNYYWLLAFAMMATMSAQTRAE